MKLYNFAFGPYPQRLTIYVAEKGLTDIELIRLDPPTDQTNWPPALLKGLTPASSLPIVVDDDGTVVGQSLAILEYLEDTRPGPDMRGRTPADRAHTRELVTVFDDALSFFALWARHGSLLNRGVDRESRDVAEICAPSYFQKLRLAERMIGDAEFLAGEAVTIADCVAMATLRYVDGFYDVPIPSDCSRLSNWYARFSSRPSVPAHDFPPHQHALARHLMTQTGISIENAHEE
ncbi:glutathione S-transferase family protein [Bradyrhizobium sp. Leo121]|uniref:glutathione S-transferase family protein n=1 Tax=Bradyrhizobium sp. Leo121 TaxID=1571195 RepID=UPI0010294C27|nr:glutathione S-transferase family protein [Bradyrhizobium sp. Leo121]RZN34698.1 glutathione S-transferase family protein [Bradyrhizobium sp. Leo121]